jgi:acyl phosphate:glycerol-3-phosphate acyltransferase
MLSLWPILFAYLIGAVPFGLLVARIFGIRDIRALGSGNIGATNVWRIAGPKAAIWVYLLDIGKGVLAVMVARMIPQEIMPRELFLTLCGLAAMLGHVFPIYLGFKGGKGVNTGLGVMISLLPLEAVIALAVFIITVAITRFISLGSILAAVILFLAVFAERFIFHRDISMVYLYLCLATAIIVLLTHRANLRRLANGTENRFSLSSRPKGATPHG